MQSNAWDISQLFSLHVDPRITLQHRIQKCVSQIHIPYVTSILLKQELEKENAEPVSSGKAGSSFALHGTAYNFHESLMLHWKFHVSIISESKKATLACSPSNGWTGAPARSLLNTDDFLYLIDVLDLWNPLYTSLLSVEKASVYLAEIFPAFLRLMVHPPSNIIEAIKKTIHILPSLRKEEELDQFAQFLSNIPSTISWTIPSVLDALLCSIFQLISMKIHYISILNISSITLRGIQGKYEHFSPSLLSPAEMHFIHNHLECISQKLTGKSYWRMEARLPVWEQMLHSMEPSSFLPSIQHISKICSEKLVAHTEDVTMEDSTHESSFVPVPSLYTFHVLFRNTCEKMSLSDIVCEDEGGCSVDILLFSFRSLSLHDRRSFLASVNMFDSESIFSSSLQRLCFAGTLNETCNQLVKGILSDLNYGAQFDELMLLSPIDTLCRLCEEAIEQGEPHSLNVASFLSALPYLIRPRYKEEDALIMILQKIIYHGPSSLSERAMGNCTTFLSKVLCSPISFSDMGFPKDTPTFINIKKFFQNMIQPFLQDKAEPQNIKMALLLLRVLCTSDVSHTVALDMQHSVFTFQCLKKCNAICFLNFLGILLSLSFVLSRRKQHAPNYSSEFVELLKSSLIDVVGIISTFYVTLRAEKDPCLLGVFFPRDEKHYFSQIVVQFSRDVNAILYPLLVLFDSSLSFPWPPELHTMLRTRLFPFNPLVLFGQVLTYVRISEDIANKLAVPFSLIVHENGKLEDMYGSGSPLATLLALSCMESTPSEMKVLLHTMLDKILKFLVTLAGQMRLSKDNSKEYPEFLIPIMEIMFVHFRANEEQFSGWRSCCLLFLQDIMVSESANILQLPSAIFEFICNTLPIDGHTDELQNFLFNVITCVKGQEKSKRDQNFQKMNLILTLLTSANCPLKSLMQSEMKDREIITLQCGEYANFVGSHYWNIQAQQYDKTKKIEKTLFRSYKRINVPRMVSCGYRGSYSDVAFQQPKTEVPVTTWDPNTVQKVNLELKEPTQYQKLLADEEKQLQNTGDQLELDLTGIDSEYNLSKETQVWSDFMRTELAPKSVFEWSNLPHSLEASFDQMGEFEHAETLLEDIYEREELLDRIRWMVEECDCMGGIQLFTDAEGLFGGISEYLINHVRDDISTTVPIMTFNLSSSTNRTPLHECTEAFSTAKLSQISSMLFPLSTLHFGSGNNFPHLSLKDPNWFQSSALMASAIDDISRSYLFPHLVQNGSSMGYVTKHMGGVAGVSLALPFSPEAMEIEVKSHILGLPPSGELLHQLGGFSSLTPYMDHTFQPSLQMMHFRGSFDAHVQSFISELVTSIPKGCNVPNIKSFQDLVNFYCGQTEPRNIVLSYEDEPFLYPPPFPHLLFDEEEIPFAHKTDNQQMQSSSVATHLQAGKNLQKMFSVMRSNLSQKRETEDIKEALNTLAYLEEDNDE